MRFFRSALGLCVAGACAHAQQPPQALTADAIMARVAVNQDAAQAERAHYVYLQHAQVISRKGKTIMCEETTEARLTPSATGSSQQLISLDGRLRSHGAYLRYTQLPAAAEVGSTGVEATDKDLNISIAGDDTMDRDLVENLRGNLTRASSKDGLAAKLFPLTSRIQADYSFRLLGHEQRNGGDCFHLEFQPKDKEEFSWKGDAYIDSTAFQPVLVQTTMSRKVPLAVRTLLGTSVPGLGFTVIYAPQPDGLWFPISFGTEFKLHVLFFLNREIVISAQNRDFEKTHVSSTIVASRP